MAYWSLELDRSKILMLDSLFMLTEIKGIGFTLCGALGFGAANSGCVYQGSLATFWGSWCFLVGSSIQWFESLDKHPVDVEEGGGRVSDTQPVA
jgi:hypothetical protein